MSVVTASGTRFAAIFMTCFAMRASGPSPLPAMSIENAGTILSPDRTALP